MKSSLTTPRPCWSAAVLPRPQRVEQNRGGGFCAHSHLRHAARRKAAWACRLDGMSGARARLCRQPPLGAHPCHPSSTFPPFLCNGTVTAAVADSARANRRRRQQWGALILRLLVIEDDPDLNRQLATALIDAGYVVDRAFDGEEGHFLGESEPYDAVILDIGLPKMDGISVLEAWRRAGRAMPVLILTARDRWSDKVQGFDAGADDYVAKPFHLEEVLARIRALLRRSAGHAKSEL